MSADPEEIGYDRDRRDRLQPCAATSRPRRPVPARRPSAPYFLSVGFFETHRDYFEPTSVRDALYSLPPAHLPDTPETRRDIAAYKASARCARPGRRHRARRDHRREHARDPHHRPRARVPRREGDADRPRDRRDADPARPGLRRRQGLRRARLPARPVPDDLRARGDRAARLAARPLAARPSAENDAVFAEITFHAAYEPQRAVRTKRYKYIRRFDNGHEGPVLANIDDSPSKTYLLAARAGRRAPAGGGALRPRVRPGGGEQPRGRPDARVDARELRDRLPLDGGHERPAAATAASSRRPAPSSTCPASSPPTIHGGAPMTGPRHPDPAATRPPGC